MAMIETWLKTDLQHVVRVQSLDGNLFSADNAANRVGVILTNNGQPSNIVGGVSAYLIRPDEATLIISGQSSDNRAWVNLPASAYAKVGPFSLVIKNGTTTIGACTGYVYRSTTDEIVDPGHVIPSIDELLAELENMRSATRAAEAVVGAANTAAANANEKASAANTAAGAANTAAANANEKASAANTAAGAANAAAANADAKASAANTAASAANTAATNADAKATAADTAAANANEKASAANTAATNANAKASAADTAATNANTKAAAANTAASAANAAAGKIDNMTVAANGLNSGSNPTATISDVSGHKHILFGIPKGNTGATPNISVGTVTTLQPNQQATVKLDQSSTPEAPVFNFGIPKGETGTIQNTYASTLEMSPTDSRKIKTVLDTKADKDTDAVAGNFAAFDANGNPVDSGHKHSDYLTQHQDISGKADKDTDAVAGNFAAFDANGNPVDSGHKHSDYLTQHQDISGKADKDADAVEGNFAAFDANGNPVDSGHKSSEYVKTINGRLPNPVTGDIVVIEGGGSSSYGAYRIDTTIAVSDWVLTNGIYRVTITSNDMADIITSNMDGSETWLDDETAMLGETTFTTFGTGSGDGGIYVDTTILPTASWNLHILLAMNGADMLSDMTGKIEDAKAIIGSGISIIVDGDTATSAIAPGEYAYVKNNTHGLAEGVYYNSSSSTFPVSGGTANSSVFSIPAKGGLNQLLNNQVSVVNNLNSDSTTSALSAAQGKALNGNFVSASVDMSGTMAQKFQSIFTIINGRNYATDKSYPVMLYISGATFNGTFTGTFNMSSGGIRFLVADETRVIHGLFRRSDNTILNIENLNSNISVQKNKDWRQVPINATQVFYYGSAEEKTTYSLPTGFNYVISCRSAETRGFAICMSWPNTENNGFWICHLHDDASPYEWSPWVKISVDTALSRNIKIAENGTFDIPIGNYGSAIITGHVGNIGSVIIAVKRDASTLVAKNMITGSDWSSTYLSFSTVTAGIRITNSNTQKACLSLMYDGSSRL